MYWKMVIVFLGLLLVVGISFGRNLNRVRVLPAPQLGSPCAPGPLVWSTGSQSYEPLVEIHPCEK